MRRTLEASGPRPADDVWDRYLRPARWPEWSPQIRSVDYPGATLSPGTTGTVRGPGRFPVRFRILYVEKHAWSWKVAVGPIRMWLRHTVEGTPRGARTTLAIRGFAPVVLLYLPLARWALHRLVR